MFSFHPHPLLPLLPFFPSCLPHLNSRLPVISFPFVSFLIFLSPPPLLYLSPCCLSFILSSLVLAPVPVPSLGPSLQAGLWVLQPPVGVGALPDMPFRAWETAGQTLWLHCHCLLGCSAPHPWQWISIRIPSILLSTVRSAAGLCLSASSASTFDHHHALFDPPYRPAN